MPKNSWVNSNEPISSITELTQPFLLSRTERDDFLVGIELEQFIVYPDSLRQVMFEGDSGIERILKKLSADYGWEQVLEKDRVIALKKDGLNVTLEPGGAIEFVSAPVKKLSVLEERISAFNRSLKSVADHFGKLVLQYGRLPFDSLNDIDLVPKSRYEFMYPYMQSVGERGQEMMKLTSSIQVAIDYETEADATKKLRLAAQATPFFIALSANSSFKEGKFTGSASDRAKIWQTTDEARSGLPEFMFDKDGSFSAYVDWGLDVPIYYLERGDEKFTGGGISFREFMHGKSPLASGVNPSVPTRGDWEQHLSTLFPWVRFRHYIEIRAFDMGPPPLQMAAGAICQGLFYCSMALGDLEDLIGDNSAAETYKFMELASSEGLGNPDINNIAKQIVEIAHSCLSRHDSEDVAYLEAYLDRLESWKLEDIAATDPKTHLKENIL